MAAAILLFAAPAVAEDRINLRLEMFGVAGLHMLSLRTQIEETNDRYSISTTYATTGVAGAMVDVKAQTQVRGLLTPTGARPDSFRSAMRRNGVDRKDQVDYYPNNIVKGSSTPPLPVPVSDEGARGTVDDLTAYFLLERQLARTGKCALTVPVFDGRHRFDLHFSDAGQQDLKATSEQRFAGPTTVCKMTRQMIVTPDDPEATDGARQGTFWYARLLPGDVMVPVRMMLDTQMGAIDGYLAEIKGRGVDLKFME